ALSGFVWPALHHGGQITATKISGREILRLVAQDDSTSKCTNPRDRLSKRSLSNDRLENVFHAANRLLRRFGHVKRRPATKWTAVPPSCRRAAAMAAQI